MKIAKKTGIREMPVFAKFVKDSDLYYKGEKVRMKNEYEITVLDIDVMEIEKKLLEIGAVKEGEFFQKRNLYNFHEEYRGRFIRLRTNGTKTTLTIKEKSAKKEIGSVKESEVEVSDFEKTDEILNMLGYEHSMYQENKRTIYRLGNIEFDIDSWPMIPTYLEIEGKSKEQVEEMIEKLEIDKNKLSLDKVSEIYKKYGFDIHDYKDLRFEN